VVVLDQHRRQIETVILAPPQRTAYLSISASREVCGVEDAGFRSADGFQNGG